MSYLGQHDELEIQYKMMRRIKKKRGLILIFNF